MENKRNKADKGIVHALPSHLLNSSIKRTQRMAEVKIGLILAYLIGIPVSAMAFISNIDTWKSSAIFIMVVIYWMGMIWFGFRSRARKEKKEQMDLRKQELDLWQEELRVNKPKK